MGKQIGAINAIVSGIGTMRDGSVKVTLEVNPKEQEVINALMNNFLIGKKLYTVGFIQINPEDLDNVLDEEFKIDF